MLSLTDYLTEKGDREIMTGSLQIRNGKFYAVTRINGKQKWINLNIEAKRGNRKEAEIAMAKVIAAIDDNPNVFDKIDFAEYMKIWLKDVKKHIDIVTYEGYKQYTEKHIIPYFEKRYRKKIKPVKRRSECEIPDSCSCPRCDAPKIYLYKNTIL